MGDCCRKRLHGQRKPWRLGTDKPVGQKLANGFQRKDCDWRRGCRCLNDLEEWIEEGRSIEIVYICSNAVSMSCMLLSTSRSISWWYLCNWTARVAVAQSRPSGDYPACSCPSCRAIPIYSRPQHPAHHLRSSLHSSSCCQDEGVGWADRAARRSGSHQVSTRQMTEPTVHVCA